MSEELYTRLKYTIEHEPVRYFVRFSFPFYYIVTANGDKCGIWWMWNKIVADCQCNLLNAVYSHGYSIGTQAILKTLEKELHEL